MADVILQTSGIKELLEGLPAGKLLIWLLYTDSGGSTNSQQLWRGGHLTDGPIANSHKVIFWRGRCRVHQAATIARESGEMCMMGANIDPKCWEKRTRLVLVALYGGTAIGYFVTSQSFQLSLHRFQVLTASPFLVFFVDLAHDLLVTSSR
ncbi:unnamed protein product [Amoebophrya sp. A25]|nr:unnamed protein product [Amoebophrya sp. A25]|eukprot:GSA25T00023384001.1